MKKFTVMVLCVSTFFMALGGLVENVGARFKSDERALEIMRLARQAIGGEENITAVQGLTVTGKATKSIEFDNASRVERGDWELNLQLPDKISRMMKVETEDNVGGGSGQTFERKVEVIVVRKGEGAETVRSDSPRRVIIVKKDEAGNVLSEDVTSTGEQPRRVVVSEDPDRNFETFHRNDFFRTVISLFLTPPQGLDAEYKFIGETDIDGTSCEIVEISSGESSVKLFIGKSSHLPVMMSYTDAKPFVFRINSSDSETAGSDNVRVTVEKPTESQMAEFHVKFSDFRSVGGLRLPFKWTQTAGGKDDEAVDITSYEINPANISDKFKETPTKVFVRTKKEQ